MRPSFFFFFCNYCTVQSLSENKNPPPKNFFASHIWPRRVRHSESIWISLTAGDQSGRERRDGRRKQKKLWKERGMRETQQDERIANKTSESAGCQGHPEIWERLTCQETTLEWIVRKWKWTRRIKGFSCITHIFLMEIINCLHRK